MNIETAMGRTRERSGAPTGSERPEDRGRLDQAKSVVNATITRVVVFGDSARASAFVRQDASSPN